MKVEFQAEANLEFREAARYYESEAPGVGLAFAAEVHKAIAKLAEFPLAARLVRGSIRKKVLPHFPYSILYAVEQDGILIVAVAHQRKRPTYWLSGLKKRN